MGGGASTSVSQKAEPKGGGSGGGNSNKTKDTDLIASPFDDLGGLEDDKNDGASPDKAVASATKLKRMALGQQTYMDHQRDYDQTLNKLELNKTNVIDWTGPTSAEKGSPQKTPKGATPNVKGGKFPDSSFLSPSEAKSGVPTPDGAARGAGAARKPPPPAAKPSGTPLQPLVNPTQQVVQAPMHTPVRGQQRGPPQSVPGGVSSSGSTLQESPQAHAASFSAQNTQSLPHRTIQQHPDHSSSGTQLVHHNHHAGPAMQSNGQPIFGPPPGLVSRPFPHQQLESSPSDVDDGMIAEFGRSVKVVDTFKRPDNVPMLSLNSPAQEMSGRVMPPRNNPQLAPNPGMIPPNVSMGKLAGSGASTPSPLPGHVAHQQGHVGPGGPQGQPHPGQGMRPVTVGQPGPGQTYGGGPRTPAMHGGPGAAGSGAPSPMMQQGRPVGMPQATPPSTAGGSGVRPAPAPAPPAGAHLNAPVVKETKNVKRNRAQIPTKLAHAVPTTGDWMNKRYIVNNYILLEVLGTGSYGEVRLCKDRTTDKLYAIKIFSKDFLKKKKTGKSDETFFEDIKREIAIMKKLLHPNVLRLFEVLDDPKVNKMYLVLEYMKMGDLINVLKARGADVNTNTTAPPEGGAASEGTFTPLTDMEVWNIFRQVVSGIRYLHYQNVVHGDIKPQNLLLGEDGIVKIADFGISQMLSASGQKLADAAGTPAFMSPELCEGKSFSGQLADIWAIGATMFMLRFGHPPFLAKSIINLYHKICNDPLVFPGPIDPGLRNLLENLLEKDPTKRYTLQQIIMHPWFRHPPSVHAAQQHLRPQPALSNQTTAVPSGAPAHGPAQSSAAAAQMATAHSFRPPDSYAAEEEAAMKVQVKIDHSDEVFMSIGGIQQRGKASTSHQSSDGKIDEEGKGSEYNSESEAGGDVGEGGEDMMNTDWGADVFQMVDDGGDSDNNVDDDSVDEDEGSDNDDSGKAGKSGKKSKNGSEGSMFATRTEMTAEEGEKRAKRFQAKAAKKSNEEMPTEGKSDVSRDSSQTSVASPQKGRTAPAMGASASSDPPSETSSNAVTPKVNRLPFKAVSAKMGPRTRGESIRGSTASRDEYDGEDVDEVSIEDLGKIMDTLARQPRKFSDAGEEDVHSQKGGAMLPIDGFSAELINKKNGIAASFNSEKGSRHTQEDRCVLLPNVAQMKGLDQSRYDAAKLELLNNFTIGCIFDGHSGWRCAQYLSQHFAPMLVAHDRFLDKTCEAALRDVCAAIDIKVCDMLMDEEDSSGSTGVVAVYDGRRHVLTVAGVGDSMCVLSRAGKAVIINRMHRLDNEDERERVKRAGGTVINNRVNGLLAISRAFGDTQFKPERDDGNSTRSPDGLVISTPEVFTEIITPMTEFAVMATDGLWDVMTPQMAVTFVRNMLHKHRDLEEAARALTKEALARGSVDNVTVLIMSFHFSDEGKIKSSKS